MSANKNVKATDTKETQILVYVGPTIPTVATHNTFYNNGITKALETAMAKEPAFKNLVVSIDKLSDATRQIKTGTGAIATFYNKVLNYN